MIIIILLTNTNNHIHTNTNTNTNTKTNTKSSIKLRRTKRKNSLDREIIETEIIMLLGRKTLRGTILETREGKECIRARCVAMSFEIRIFDEIPELIMCVTPGPKIMGEIKNYHGAL